MPSVDGEYVFGEQLAAGASTAPGSTTRTSTRTTPRRPSRSQRWAVGVDPRPVPALRLPLGGRRALLLGQPLPLRLQGVLRVPEGPLHRVADLRRDALRARRTATASSAPSQWARRPAEPRRPGPRRLPAPAPAAAPRVSGVPQKLDKVLPGLVGSFDVDYTNYWRDRTTARRRLQRARNVDDLFVDTGIDAIPDGQERDSDGRIFRPDGTVEPGERPDDDRGVRRAEPDVAGAAEGRHRRRRPRSCWRPTRPPSRTAASTTSRPVRRATGSSRRASCSTTAAAASS